MKRVLIIGAGVIGLLCAVRLAQKGARVTVLEAEPEPAYSPGASAAAAGMLAPLEHDLGAHAPLAFASLDLWRAWREGAHWADSVRFDGGVIVARGGEDADAHVRAAAANSREAALLSHSQFRNHTGFKAKVEHALFTPDEGALDPKRALSGLAMQARAHGIVLRYRREAETLTPHAVATFEGERFEADVIVVAAGYWGRKQLAPYAPALTHLCAAKGQMLGVAVDAALGPNLRTPEFYLTRRLEDVALGATVEPGRTDRRVDKAKTAALLAAAEGLLPGEIRGLGYAWAGVRPMSPDGWPMIGPGADGILIAAGHSRNGWLMAPITAEIISAYVFGAEIPAAWAALSPERFDVAGVI